MNETFADDVMARLNGGSNEDSKGGVKLKKIYYEIAEVIRRVKFKYSQCEGTVLEIERELAITFISSDAEFNASLFLSACMIKQETKDDPLMTPEPPISDTPRPETSMEDTHERE